MDRERVIQCLMQHEIDRLERGRSSLWLLRVLECGFPGFGSMSDQELRDEAAQRGLNVEADFEDIVDPEDDVGDIEQTENDNEIRFALSELVWASDAA